jgi:hypothetical protein
MTLSVAFERALSSTPGGRIVQALIDSNDRLQQLARRLQESEADRDARLGQIHELTQPNIPIDRWKRFSYAA